MLKLHAHPFSHNSRKIHWALEELGQQYEYELVDLPTGAQKRAEFLALNPLGRLPVAVFDDGLVLSESGAILQRLGGSLFPADPADAARVSAWLFWEASDLQPVVSRPLIMQVLARMGVAPLDQAAHARAVAEAAPALQTLDAALASRSHIVGDQLSAADIALAETVGAAADAGIDLAPHGNLRSWRDALARRPAFQKTRPQLG